MDSAKLHRQRSFLVLTMALSLIVAFVLSSLLCDEVVCQVTYDVRIVNFAFAPQNLTINVGDTIRWNNTDPVIHTLWFVFVVNGSTYLLSDPIAPDTVWSHTFNTADQFQYYSFDMLWITGFINVQAAGVHDVAVASVSSAKTVICQGSLGNITATVENQGDFHEAFNVTAYADLAVIGEESVSLPSGGSTDVVFTWNATGFSKGNYTVKVEADIVSGETDTADNTYVDGWVIISMLGDITGPDGWPDGKCDMRDIGLVARHFGKTAPPAPTNCDIVYDMKIDMRDVGTAARHFGETDP